MDVPKRLGLKDGMRVAALNFAEGSFLGEHAFDRSLVAGGAYDAILLHIVSEATLRSVRTVRRALSGAGALWIVSTRGAEAIPDRFVLAAGRGDGFREVRRVRIDETTKAVKFARKTS